ncbi:MAG: hypothetical protein ACI9LO_001791 [Planctomycetota bacterium]|jgi:hypothetical protein
MRLILFALLLSSATPGFAAVDWDKRLAPTVGEIDEEAWSLFNLNCRGGFIELLMQEFQPPKSLDPLLQPRKKCLQGIFQNTFYHKRDKSDPIAYKTNDGKPYLELFFSFPGKYVESDAPLPPPDGKTIYSLKMILHDFKGKGVYPIYHQNETFQPRYDKDQPVGKTKAGVPYLNYSKGAHIPLIFGNFAAMHETSAFTFSTGARRYGSYDAPYLDKVIPADKRLGQIEITDIDKTGKMNGSFYFRMLHETCSDPLAISHCKLSSNFVEGKFTAKPFKPNKQYLKQDLDTSEIILLKPKLKPRLNTGTPAPQSELVLIDTPQPRTHKPLMGYQCKGPVAGACRRADSTFDSYLNCMKDNNFARNKASDTASINKSRAALQLCANKYTSYLTQSRTCRKLFIDDKNCTE